MSGETNLLKFVRQLVRGGRATRDGATFVTDVGLAASTDQVRVLVIQGALSANPTACWANGMTAGWLRRALLDRDGCQSQRRYVDSVGEGITVNIEESPLQRLAGGQHPFLERHHVEAGERVRRLYERAQLRSRVTMTYSPAETTGSSSHRRPEISDLAIDARRAISDINRLLPRDCAGVVVDVCGLLKGLQEVERERAWPRRSAKLVLRIGLEQLAHHYGLSAIAVGKVGRTRRWIDEGARPQTIG